MQNFFLLLLFPWVNVFTCLLPMELHMEEKGAGQILLVPAQQPLSQLVPDQSFLAKGHLWEAVFEYFHGPGFFASYSKMNIARPVILSASGNTPALELRFMLGEPLQGKWDGIADPVLLRDQFSLSYTPYISTEAQLRKGMYETFDIHFELFLLERMADDFPLLSEFINKIHQTTAAELTPVHHYCTMAMRSAIESLLRHPYTARSQPYLLQAKVIELLLAALEITDATPAAPGMVLTTTDIEALHEVKRRIEADESIALSYKELQRCGLNENKLLNGFKALFGSTPYQHHMGLKMKKAHVLLVSTTDTVTEIAYTLGYRQVSNFSLEFTKRYGCSPMEFRRRNRKRP